MKYLVAIPLPEPQSSSIRSIQRQFGPTTWHITMEPHITVIAPGQALVTPDQAAQLFTRLPLPAPPLTIRANQISRFTNHHRHTLVLLPESSNILHRLFNAILPAAATWQTTTHSTGRPYTPHITLANQLSNHQAAQAEQQLTQLRPDLTFECTTITLFAKDHTQAHWHEIANRQL